MGFPRQEYWRALPFPTPGDRPDPGIEPMSLMFPALAGGFFTSEPPGKPPNTYMHRIKSSNGKVGKGWEEGVKRRTGEIDFSKVTHLANDKTGIQTQILLHIAVNYK